MKVANEQRKKLKGKSGITLIALVITVIVLLILAGISITMLTGDNSILNQATNAKESTIKGSEQEAISIAYNGVLTNNLGSVTEVDDFAQKLKEELRKNGYDVDVRDNGKTVEFNDTKNVYKLDIAKGTVTKKEQQDRSKINVGDFVEYTPPTREAYSTYLTEAYTGSSANSSITQQYKIWRVLNKNDDGTLDLIPAFTKTDLPSGTTDYTSIYFRDAKGYNNGVYILDDICKTLYEKTNSDADKSITARSLDYEDITKLLVSNENEKGIRKLESYKKTQVDNLKTNEQESLSFITNKDENKITYKERTWYPLLYPNPANTLTNVLANESDPFYKTKEEFESSAISNGKVATAPTNLEVEYTSISGTMKPTDFQDYNPTKEESKQHEVIFGTGTRYWLASRNVYCNLDYACFGLRDVIYSYIRGYSLFLSNGDASGTNFRVCPIVSLGSNVPVTAHGGTNEEGKRHVVQIPQ